MGILTDYERGEYFCKFCGFVLNEKIIDMGKDWNFDQGLDGRRTGQPVTFSRHDKGLITIFDPFGNDGMGHPLSYEVKNKFKRLQIQDKRIHCKEYHDAKFIQAFKILERISDKLSLSTVVKEEASLIFRKAILQKITQGRSVSFVVSASIYAACRKTNTLRSLHDVAVASNISRKNLARMYRLLVKELNLQIPVVDSLYCLIKIANSLGIKTSVVKIAEDIIKKAQQIEVSAGKDPMGLAASALYIASVKTFHDVSQKKLALVSGVTEVTIRNRCKDLKQTILL